jgi:hypothetical protein
VVRGVGQLRLREERGMRERALLVADEFQVVEGIRRAHRKRVEAHTATSGAEGQENSHSTGFDPSSSGYSRTGHLKHG